MLEPSRLTQEGIPHRGAGSIALRGETHPVPVSERVQLDLGHVGALYENLKRITSEKVAAEVRAEEAEQRIWHLERQLAAKRVENNELEDGDDE